ncbi:hypothetical protein RRG08_031206 [Elysia crispata]|uniref:Uncharacterized protein n=1 Tax=Elysia crispata TaxID=231223 RepID=A0AAE0XN06_9GAST|nr:hypothetical protein RRG08_031206 [Elysia crispata]
MFWQVSARAGINGLMHPGQPMKIPCARIKVTHLEGGPSRMNAFWERGLAITVYACWTKMLSLEKARQSLWNYLHAVGRGIS